MGVFSRSSTTATSTTDNFIDSRATNADQAGAASAVTGDGNRTVTNITDGGAVRAAANVTMEAIKKAAEQTRDGFGLADKIFSAGSDADERRAKLAYDFSGETLNKTLSLVDDSQRNAYSAIDSGNSGAFSIIRDLFTTNSNAIASNAETTRRATDNAMQYVYNSARPDAAASESNNKMILYIGGAVLGLFAFSRMAK